MNELVRIAETTSLSLNLPKDQSFEDWLETGKNLASANKAIQWWIGDWWAAGSHRYGERAKVAAEGLFGREFQTLRNVASVCRAFETSRRRDTLSFAHHAEVAALDPKVADQLLEKAARDGWTRNDIRAEVKLLKPSAHSGAHRDFSIEAVAWSYLAGAWKQAPTSVRERFLASLDGLELVE